MPRRKREVVKVSELDLDTDDGFETIENEYKKRMQDLTPLQRRFVEEYLIDLNSNYAYIRAGYKGDPKSGTVNPRNIKTNPKVKECIEMAMAIRSKRTGITAERVLAEAGKLLFANITDIVDDDGTIKFDASRDDTSAISYIRYKTIPTENGELKENEVRMADKIKVMENVMRHLGMFANQNTGIFPEVKFVKFEDEELKE